MNPQNLAFKLLGLLAPGREALAGDLLEQVQKGRSALWLWRQVIGAIVTGCIRDVREDRIGALKVVAIGWATMLGFFFIAGDFLAHSGDQTVPRLLSYLGAHHAGVLWLERLRYVPATVIGCVLSGWIVGRPVLFYAASVCVALAVAATAIAWYAAPVSVPHTLFYVVMLALPYWWWSGLLIVPLLIVVGGLWRVASSEPLGTKGTLW
jgi:hypothetical protein